MISPRENIAANLLVRQGAKPQTATDATAVVSEIYDRLSSDMRTPQSCMVVCALAFTSASGASGATNTLLLELYHDTASNMATEAALDTDTYVYTWAADGANHGVHVLPVNLKGANRYLRAKATLTESGTITISSQSLATCVVFAGMLNQPSSTYAAAGYEETTEPS
jgi:hypothetical protein